MRVVSHVCFRDMSLVCVLKHTRVDILEVKKFEVFSPFSGVSYLIFKKILSKF